MAGTYSAGDRTKSEILKGSRKLFYKKGYTETTYNDISEYLGINRALIPYHFKSKDLLAFSLYSELKDYAISKADELLDTASLSKDLETAFNAIIFYRLFDNKHFANFTCELINDNPDLFYDDSIDSQALRMFAEGNSKAFLDKNNEQLISGSLCAIRYNLIGHLKTNKYSPDELAKLYIKYALNSIDIYDNTVSELFDSAVQLANLVSIEMRPGFQLSVTYR